MSERIKVEAKEPAPLGARPWTAHYDPGVPASLIYPAVPLQALLDDAAESHPNATATIFFNRKRSYRSISDAAWRFANGLRRLGVKKGDRIALVLPNTPQFVIAFYGALRAGAIVVPCNPLYTQPELQHQLADSGATVVVALSRLYPVVKAARANTAVEHVIVTNIKEEMPPILRVLFTLAKEGKDGHRQRFAGDPGAVGLSEVLSAPAEPFDAGTTADDLAVLQYTGGTTGVSKGAMLSHRALVANTLQCRAWFTNLRDGGDAAMAVMPFFHVYGLTVVMNLAVLRAMTMVLIPRPDLRHIFLAIQKHRPRFFPGAPRIYILLNNSPDLGRYDLRSIEWFLSGSAPLPVEVMKRFEELTGGKVLEGYGLTEAAPVTHSNPRQGIRKPGSVGLPMPDVDCKIVDIETGTHEVGAGEAGELCLRGPNLMDGYWQRPEETAAVLRDGWLYTGDIVRMDEDGYFSVVDRKKEMIIVSGFKVYPREVDEVLYTHPGVLEAAAVGVPHPSKGEVVKAFVVLRPGATATAQQLMDHCRANLAPYKVPVEIVFRAELPKTLIGKVLRRQLAAEEPGVPILPLPRAG